MNQQCKVCAEPAAGFHFGAFTCEGCKSFFGRTYNNLSQINECKNGGQCVINKQNRTSCKACRLRKCLLVGMSKSGSRYGRRSNWFKIHCALQEQAANISRNLEANQQLNIPQSSGQTTLLPPGLMSHNPFEDTKVFNHTNIKHNIRSQSPESLSDDEVKKNWRNQSFSPKNFSPDESCKPTLNLPKNSPVEEGNPFAPSVVAGLSIYGMQSGLSLLQASQIYQRLYPSMFYSNMTAPILNNLPTKSEENRSASNSPVISNNHHQPPSPSNSLPPPSSQRESISNPPSPQSLPSRPFSSNESPSPPLMVGKKRSAAPEQDEPIDLSVKRTKFSHSIPDLTPLPFSLFQFGGTPSAGATVPVDLTTTA